MSADVSIVFLSYNRRDELRESLSRMTGETARGGSTEVIAVDNASTDGSAEMVRREFPGVRLIARERNCGVSGFNDGFAAARGDWVLALDDDCHLRPGGLDRAVAAGEAHGADLVSFAVESAPAPGFRFDRRYRTGLLSFWGCAVLMRRRVVESLGGYDPDIFVWANELEFMLRFYDRGFRHLHLPEVPAVHMKDPGGTWRDAIDSRPYRVNARNFAYVAGKALRPRDAAGALVARVAVHVRDAVRVNPAALKAVPPCLAGFLHGLRRRQPVAPAISRTYRRDFETFASPWWVARPLAEFLPGRRPEDPGRRREQYFARRARFYPATARTLEF